MSQCLKIKSISGMTSSIRNLGKFGEPYQTGFLLSGEQEDECKGVYSYVNEVQNPKQLISRYEKQFKRL